MNHADAITMSHVALFAEPHNKSSKRATASYLHVFVARGSLLHNCVIAGCLNLRRPLVKLYLKNYRDYVISDVPLPEQLLPVIRREG